MNNELLLTSIYRRTAITFLILTIALLAIVAIVVLPKALLVVTPEPQNFEERYFFTVSPVATDETEFLHGAYVATSLALEQTFPGRGTEEVVESLAGTITLVNNYSRSQPLIASTRLLTNDGVQLRLKDGVTVPAGGEVEAEIYLDSQTPLFGPLDVQTLIIPGLWEGLQDQIYGVVSTPLEGVTKQSMIVTSDDITFGQNTLREKAEAQAATQLSEFLKTTQITTEDNYKDWTLILTTIVNENWDIPDNLVGSAEASFTLGGTFAVEGVFYNEAKASEKVLSRYQESGALIKGTILETDVILTETPHLGNEAEVMITVIGESQQLSNEGFLELYHITGLTQDEAIQYLTSQDTIADVSIELSPFWVKKIPKNNIDIVIFNGR